jgi:hypothetical protein
MALASFAANLYNIFTTILNTIYHFSRKAEIYDAFLESWTPGKK